MIKHISWKIILGVIALVVFFQNCSDVKVERTASVAPPEPAKQVVNFNLCPVVNSGITSRLRLMFIVDMSLSNLGDIGSVTECGNGGNSYNFVPNSGTDFTANPKRITAIQDFISAVGSSASADLSYAILGFTNVAMLGSDTISCSTAINPNLPFINNQLNSLINIQRTNLSFNGACHSSPPFTMSTTSYDSAIRCLDTSVKTDMVYESEQRPFYQVFFVTDGKPNEADSSSTMNINALCSGNATCINNMQACINANVISDELCLAQHIYKPKIQSLYQEISAEGNGFNFKPIFYGKASEQTEAVRVLNELAQADGSNTTTKVLSSDGTAFSTELIEEFRDALGVQATSNYTFSLPIVVNLTAVPSKDKLVIDSDADGVADSVEDALGWNKLNARSQGVLDGLCYNFLSGANCTPPTGVNCNTKVGLGLNLCDQEVAKRIWGNSNLLTGFDSDSDGVTDFIEIIRGTNPMLSDVNLDSDQDGVKNLREILNGTDPFDKKTVIDSHITQFGGSPVFYSQSQCAFEGEGRHANLDNVSFAKSLAFDSAENEFDHTADENLVLVTFVAEPLGMNPVNNRLLYYVILKLNSEGKYNKIELKNSDLTRVNGAF